MDTNFENSFENVPIVRVSSISNIYLLKLKIAAINYFKDINSIESNSFLYTIF